MANSVERSAVFLLEKRDRHDGYAITIFEELSSDAVLELLHESRT